MNKKLGLFVEGIEYRAELAAREAHGKGLDSGLGPTPREAWDQAYNAALRECGSTRLARKLADRIAEEKASTG